MGDHITPGAERRLLLGIGVIYLALALVYSWVIPLGYGPDEKRHYALVKRLAEKGRLPLTINGQEEDGAIVLHPPLYYAGLVPLYVATRPLGDAAAQRALRFVSPLLCGGALFFFYLLLRGLYPEGAALRLGAVGLAAFWPHLQLEAAVINNDTLAILFGALLFWQLARMERRAPTPRESLWIGLTWAAFANTKATALTLAPLWAIWLALVFGRRGLRQGAFWQALALGYGPLLLLGSWWYLRNLALYGEVVPNIAGYMQPVDMRTGRIYEPLELLYHGLLFVGPFWWLVGRAIKGLFLSVWAQVGWFPKALNPFIVALLLLLLAAAGLGNLMAWWQKRRGSGRPTPLYPPTVWMMFVAFALVYASTAFMAIFIHVGFYQGGRYLLPVFWGFVFFIVYGLAHLAPKAQARLFLGLTSFFLLLNGACLYNLITYWNPMY
ncbi:MAG: hypothetical protein QHJ73_08530, partial [Armatimonadota bacterium]|nr:hypothetical protein [Armatimonadota bacterium]